jgi:hypothetical protein
MDNKGKVSQVLYNNPQGSRLRGRPRAGGAVGGGAGGGGGGGGGYQ